MWSAIWLMGFYEFRPFKTEYITIIHNIQMRLFSCTATEDKSMYGLLVSIYNCLTKSLYVVDLKFISISYYLQSYQNFADVWSIRIEQIIEQFLSQFLFLFTSCNLTLSQISELEKVNNLNPFSLKWTYLDCHGRSLQNA